MVVGKKEAGNMIKEKQVFFFLAQTQTGNLAGKPKMGQGCLGN